MRAVLFDGFGTLYRGPRLDSEAKTLIRAIYSVHKKHHEGDSAYFKRHKRETQKLIRTALTHDYNFIDGIAETEPELADVIRRYEKIIPDLVSQITLYEDAIPTLLYLKSHGFKTGIVSDSTTRAKPDLERLGLVGLLDVQVWSFEHHAMKPESKLFSDALSELGMTADDVVMVGDSIHRDVYGAQNAHIKPILLDRRKSNRNYNGARITSLSSLPEYLSKN